MSQERRILHNIYPKIFRGHSNSVVPIGDDGFVFTPPQGHSLISTQDMLMENIHFDMVHFSAADIGYKALSVNISDIVAMGGAPLWAQVSLAVPQADEAWIGSFYESMARLADQVGLEIVGGDLIRSTGPVVIDINIIGSTKNPLRKFQWQPGDCIAVSGPLGDAAAGLEIMQKKKSWTESETFLANKQRRPKARTDLLPFLQKPDLICHCLTDISDSLAQELESICEKTQMGAKLNAIDFRSSPFLSQWCAENNKKVEDYFLYGGENYELLAAFPAQQKQQWLDLGWAIIGQVSPSHSMTYIDLAGQPCDISSHQHSWSHWNS
ncbi:MAG: thiamine-phosphate kinase [Pseudobdellovibrionaceae bacterium]